MSLCVAEWSGLSWYVYRCDNCNIGMDCKYWRVHSTTELRWNILCRACVESSAGPAELSHYIKVKVGVYTGYLYSVESLTMYQARCQVEILDNNPVLEKI